MPVQFPPLSAFEIQLRQDIYVGRNPANGLKQCWATGRDAVCLIAPPGYGKTSIVIPAVMCWPGPVVSTSTRGDVLDATGNWRAQLAAACGGRNYIYDPFGSELGVTSMRWSPAAGCDDPSVAYRRAMAMTATAGKGVTDGHHWSTGAAGILRGAFHAAALAGEPTKTIRTWLAKQDFDTPAEIIRQYNSRAVGWADDLEAVAGLSDKERSSFYSVARNCLDATADPVVLDSAAATDLDVDEFLTTGSTLYIVGPSHLQKVTAPLIVGLIDSITQRAAELAAHAGGRLDPALLLALDEVPNTAPLDSLGSLVSEGGGRGIRTLWTAQSLAAVRSRYGTEEASAILTATAGKLLFGGMSNGDDLRNVSGWAGEFAETQVTRHGDMGWDDSLPQFGTDGQQQSGQQTSMGTGYRPVLPVDRIQQAPPGYAWLFYRSDPPLLVEARPAHLIESYAKHFGYTRTPVGGDRP